MPFYEYQCKNCGHELEAMQKVSDAPLKKCPDCGKPQLTRLMSAPVFRLKGGGWYETDFKGDKEKQRNLADKPEDAPKDAKDSVVKPAEEKSKDAKPVEAKADAPSAKEATSQEKQAGKSDKTSGGGGQKPASGTRTASRAGRSRRKPIKVKRRR